MELRGFWRAARAEPERIALVDPEGREIRAGELAAAANRIVHGLRARGVRPGDVVASALGNGAPLLEVMLAAFQAGWHYTPVNPHLTAGEIAYLLGDSGAKAFFADASSAAAARPAADQAALPEAARFGVGSLPGFRSLASLQAGQSDALPDARVAGQFMQYTSGTTGRPKAVRRVLPELDPETLLALWAPNLTRYGIEPGGDDVHLVTSPMAHMAPLAFAWFSLHFEHRLVLMDRFDAQRTLELVERHRVTTTHMVPTQFHRLLRLPGAVRAAHDVSSLRRVLHAAAPCPVEVKRRMLEWWGPVLWEYYGATEGGGTLVRPEEWLRRPGTVGRPWPGADVKVLDDAGLECPPGRVGTVYLKLLAEFEYKGDPEKTRAGRRGGYFTVGDVGELDEEGWLFLRDRKIDMIITGGVNVYPAEVEAALLAHPEVADAAVFGIPHEEWGEQVKAVVEPAPGASPGRDLEERLLAHCRERLAGYKCPRSVDFSDALPRDPNGKLYKRRLRDPWWAERGRAL